MPGLKKSLKNTLHNFADEMNKLERSARGTPFFMVNIFSVIITQVIILCYICCIKEKNGED